MSKEKDKILRTLEHIAITFDKLGFSPTIPICTGHKDFEYLFKLELDIIKELCNQQDQRIAELEEQLKNAIRFKTPQIERFAVVQYIHWEKKPYKIVNCFDAYKDENMETRYCFYGVPSTSFKVIQICDTKEEAQAKLEELGENK